MLIEDKNL